MLVDEPAVLPWSQGSLLSTRLASTFLRITSRGLIASSNTLDRAALLNHHWTHEPCALVASALCQGTDSEASWLSSGTVDVPDDWGQLPDTRFMRMVNLSTTCRHGDTGRVVSVSDRSYEVSLCDLQDLALDIVYDSTSGELFWRRAEASVYELLAIVLVTIYLISSVAQNIVHMFRADTAVVLDPKQKQRLLFTENSMIAVITTYVLLKLIALDFHVLVVVQDRVLILHLLLYAIATGAYNYLCHEELKRSGIPGVNISVITACLVSFGACVYFTFENTFMYMLTILFGWRTFVKLLTCNGAHVLALAFAVFDALVFCSILENAFSGASLYDVENSIHVVLLLSLALVLSTVSCKYIQGEGIHVTGI